MLRGVFRLLPQVGKVSSTAVTDIRELLTSRDPNDQYTFISCLECVDPVSWAGVTSGTPTVFEAYEVERMMQFLDSSDVLIRKKVGSSYDFVPHDLTRYNTVDIEDSEPDRRRYCNVILFAICASYAFWAICWSSE